MEISQYIIIRKIGSTYSSRYASRMTSKNPALQSNEVAVKVRIELPDAIFNKPALEAKIVVPVDAVSKPIITAETIDNVEQIIKQNMGFDVRLEMISKEEEKEN